MANRPPIPWTTPHLILASGLLSGCFSEAPGTLGSVACLGVWLIAVGSGLCLDGVCAATLPLAVTAVGLWATRRCLADLARLGAPATDPQFVVIDEWAGLLIPLGLASPTAPLSWLLAFVLFRLFDIAKPWPVSAAERLPGAWGVMADDIVAGLLAAAVLYGVQPFIS